MKKIILSSFILVLLVFFVYSDYCGSRSIDLTTDTPIVITLRDCSDPDAFSEIYNSSGDIISSEELYIGNGTSCPTNLQFCAVGYSNTSEYVNITLTRFLNGSEETIESELFLNVPINRGDNETDPVCFESNIPASIVGQVWIMRSNSSFYDSDEGALKESDVSEVHATIRDCHDPDDCKLHIAINSTTCLCDEIIYKIKVTKERDESIRATSAEIYFNGSSDLEGESDTSGWFEFSKPASSGTYEIEAKKSGCESDSINSIINDDFLEDCAPCTSRYLNYNISEVICHSPICIADLIFNVYDNETRDPVEGANVQILSSWGAESNFTDEEGVVVFSEFPYIYGEPNTFFINPPDGSIIYSTPTSGTIDISSDESSEDSCMVPCFLCRAIGYEGCDPTCDLGIGFDCCCDYCHPGTLKCVECFNQSVACTNTSQCCDGLSCYEGICDCAESDETCYSDLPCCDSTTVCDLESGECVPCLDEGESGCPETPCCSGYTCEDEKCVKKDEPDDDEDDDPNSIIPPNQNETEDTEILWLWQDEDAFGDTYGDNFFNSNFVLRSGCEGLFIIIGNWIFCDLLWLILLVLSVIAAYKYRDYPLKRKMSILTFAIPIAIGFLTYVWIGIIIAIFEILLRIINPPKEAKIKKGDKK